MAFLLGDALGAFAKSADLAHIAQNIRKIELAGQVRRLQNIKAGQVVGSATPQAAVDPAQALASYQRNGKAAFTQSQIQSLIAKGPQAIEAATKGLSLPKGINEQPTFYTDPETGKLGATYNPVVANDTYAEAHIAHLYMTSGIPQFVTQGYQMQAAATRQQEADLQLKQAGRQNAVETTLTLMQTNPEAGMKFWTNYVNSSEPTVLGKNKMQFTYNPSTKSVTTELTSPNGQVISSSQPMPLFGSADGRVSGFADNITASLNPQLWQQHRIATANAINQYTANQARLTEAHAAVLGAEAQGTQAQAALENVGINKQRLEIQAPYYSAMGKEMAGKAELFGDQHQLDQLKVDQQQLATNTLQTLSNPNATPQQKAAATTAALNNPLTRGMFVRPNQTSGRMDYYQPGSNAYVGSVGPDGTTYFPNTVAPYGTALNKMGYGIHIATGSQGLGYYTSNGTYIPDLPSFYAAHNKPGGGGAGTLPGSASYAPAPRGYERQPAFNAPGAMPGASPAPAPMAAPQATFGTAAPPGVTVSPGAMSLPGGGAAAPMPVPAAMGPAPGMGAIFAPNPLNGRAPMLNGAGAIYGGGGGAMLGGGPLSGPVGMMAMYGGQ